MSTIENVAEELNIASTAVVSAAVYYGLPGDHPKLLEAVQQWLSDRSERIEYLKENMDDLARKDESFVYEAVDGGVDLDFLAPYIEPISELHGFLKD